MKREVPAYIERAILALSDPERSHQLSEALAKSLPHCTWYVGTALTNAYEGLKRKDAKNG